MSFDHENRIHIGNLGPGDVAMLKNVAKETAKETVREFAIAMGIDPDEPFEAQQDMQFMRKTRKRAEGIHGKVILGAVGIVLLNAMQWLWFGFKSAIASNTPLSGPH